VFLFAAVFLLVPIIGRRVADCRLSEAPPSQTRCSSHPFIASGVSFVRHCGVLYHCHALPRRWYFVNRIRDKYPRSLIKKLVPWQNSLSADAKRPSLARFPHARPVCKAWPLRAGRLVEGYVCGRFTASPFHGFSIESPSTASTPTATTFAYLDWKVFGGPTSIISSSSRTRRTWSATCSSIPARAWLYRKRRRAVLESSSMAQPPPPPTLGLPGPPSTGQRGPGPPFDSEVRSLVPAPSSNPSHLKQLLHVMESASAQRKKPSIGPMFHDLARAAERSGAS